MPYFEDLYSIELEKLLGKARSYNQQISKHHKDLAASTQEVFEEIIIDKLNNKVQNIIYAIGWLYFQFFFKWKNTI